MATVAVWMAEACSVTRSTGERIFSCRLGDHFLGLGLHLGQPVSQSNLGELVGHVINVGGGDRRERSYRNSRELSLHTDRCDHIGMLCLDKAKSGGLSGYCSALAVHNEMLADAFSRCLFSYIDLAVLEHEALESFDKLTTDDAFCLNMMLEPGEANFTNNCLLLRRRTAFEDDAQSDTRRHLLRLWLSDPERPCSNAARAHKTTRGIVKRDGAGTYYARTWIHAPWLRPCLLMGLLKASEVPKRGVREFPQFRSAVAATLVLQLGATPAR